MKQKLLKLIKKLIRKNNIFFVGATDILPPPLSKEEEDKLLNVMKILK